MDGQCGMYGLAPAFVINSGNTGAKVVMMPSSSYDSPPIDGKILPGD